MDMEYTNPERQSLAQRPTLVHKVNKVKLTSGLIKVSSKLDMTGTLSFTHLIYEKLRLNAKDIGWLSGTQPYGHHCQNNLMVKR